MTSLSTTESDAFALESRRLAALHALELLDSEPEREFDDLALMAAELLGCATGFVTLIDRDRQWMKASFGSDASETRRDQAFCDVTIRSPSVLVVEDATQDVRFCDNDLVTSPGGIRFYAGAPIHTVDQAGERHAIGALCVIGDHARGLDDRGRATLGRLARVADAVVAARAVTRQALALAGESQRRTAILARKDQAFRQVERMAAIGSWQLSIADQRVEWTEGVFHIHGLPVGEMPSMADALDFYPPHARAEVAAAIARAIEHGEPFDIEVDFIDAAGRLRRVRSIGELEHADGVPSAIVGVFHDVTARHALEATLRRNADTDSLTGIANRAAFDRALEAAMARASADGSALLLALVDLDGFKLINDTLGHVAGDDVLRAVGRALYAPWLCGSLAARLGGDEFAVIVTDATLCAAPAALVDRIENELRMPVQAEGVALISAGTVGAAMHDVDCRTVRDFVHRADTNLYIAKRARVGDRRREDRRTAA